MQQPEDILHAGNSATPRKLWSIPEFRRLLRTREVSAVETVTALLDDMRAKRELNIFITETHDKALNQARDADKRLAAGVPRALDGIPIAVKDNFCTKGIKTTAGSKMLAVSRKSEDGFVPTYESSVTQRLLDAGAVILGKTNMDEFAMGSSTETSYFGPTINPVGVRLGFDNLVPGGSSGGSAAAIAAGLAVGAIGTDTGGSIRQPASFCGVVGMKPSYGVCSRWGIIAYASSLDQAGAFGKSVRDVAAILDVIGGEDQKDATSVSSLSLRYEAALAQPQKKLRIGFPREIMRLKATADVESVWTAGQKIAQQLGAEVVDVSIPSLGYALPAYYIIALSEASSNLSRYDGIRYGYRANAPKDIIDLYERTRAEGFGEEVKRRIILGTYSLSAGYYDAYYLRALKVRRILADEFSAVFQKVDAMFMPATPTGAFEIGAHEGDPVQMYLEDVFTVPVNLAGLPAISVPVSRDCRGMPLGLQVIGPQLGDEKVVQVAAAIEATTAH